MKRKDRTPEEKAVDDVLAVAMALAHQMRTDQPYGELQKKFLRATRRLELSSGKTRSVASRKEGKS